MTTLTEVIHPDVRARFAPAAEAAGGRHRRSVTRNPGGNAPDARCCTRRLNYRPMATPVTPSKRMGKTVNMQSSGRRLLPCAFRHRSLVVGAQMIIKMVQTGSGGRRLFRQPDDDITSMNVLAAGDLLTETGFPPGRGEFTEKYGETVDFRWSISLPP
jgi:hypothetical protein